MYAYDTSSMSQSSHQTHSDYSTPYRSDQYSPCHSSQPSPPRSKNTRMYGSPCLTREASPIEDSRKRSGHGSHLKSSDEELCLICGDRASGYHYNALSCEGCKGFFRRSVTRNVSYVCKYNGHCEMDMWMRRKCPACRLRQCRDVGMKEECLLSDGQCLARNARRQQRKPRQPDSTVKRASKTHKKYSPYPAPLMINQNDTDISRDAEDSLLPCGKTSLENILENLLEEHRMLVQRIVSYQDKFELPSKEDVARLSDLKLSSSQEPADMSDAIFTHMVEMTILVTRLVIEFAKHLPGFQTLDKDDQIILLKGSASEVMMLRTARRYDPETNTVVFGNGTPFTSNSMAFGGLQGHVDSMFEFSRGMSRLAVDNAEYALITALSIFSERPGLQNVAAVECIQDVYTKVLIAYTGQRRDGQRLHLPKLIMKLVELRSLSAEHSQVLYNLKLERRSLPPLLSEYFDIAE